MHNQTVAERLRIFALYLLSINRNVKKKKKALANASYKTRKFLTFL